MLSDYVAQFMPQNLRDLLLEFLTQLWFARLLKMKQKTIGKGSHPLPNRMFLAPTEALVLMMVYYIYIYISLRPLF